MVDNEAPGATRERWSAALAAEARDWETHPWYDTSRAWRESEWERHLRPLGLSLAALKGDRLLDVGCGPTGLVYFADAAERVGLDPNADTYRQWNGHWGEPIDLIAAQGEQMPFDAGHFDTVACVNCLDHTQNPAAVLGEIARVLRPGGRLILHVDLDSPLRKLHKLLKPGTAGLQHPHSLTFGWLTGELGRAGLQVEVTERDPQAFRATWQQMRYEAFWDGLAYRLTRSARWMNHVWLRASRR
jgi:SAM-dependent methyltransferase